MTVPHYPAGVAADLDVVVVGEALIDIIHAPEGPREFAGGSCMNVAFGLGRLGVRTGLLTVLGDDGRGARIRNHLQSAGVQLLPGATQLPTTSTATAFLDGAGSAEYEFDIQWTLPAVNPTFLPKVLHTGSLATFLEPGASHVRSIVGNFAGRCMLTYDPNIRPQVIGNHAQAHKTFEQTASMVDVVKLSDEDAARLYPGLRVAEVARRLLQLGPAMIAVTAGSAGSFLMSKSAHVEIPAPPTTVADTVGAGDAYMACLISELLKEPEADYDHHNLQRLGSVATAAAAITVSRHGANPPTASELDGALRLISVQ